MTTTQYEYVTIQERGNGFPASGDYVYGREDELYRVVRLHGDIRTDGGAGNCMNATVVRVEWDACPESEVHTADVREEIEATELGDGVPDVSDYDVTM